MRAKGFTLIELIIGLAIIGIAATMLINFISVLDGKSTISFGLNGVTEIRCVSGYKFIHGADGSVRQVMDEFGKGVRCDN
jgi:prepilin-type N-terminal cleavage/methylation domain-containing protein